MPQKKKLLRGYDDFYELITRGGYFVDKTLLIQEVIDEGQQVILLPRPRRFGKSLNLSMLANFFDVNKSNNAKLFKGYKIWKAGKKYTDKLAKYPVIKLSFKEMNGTTFEECLEYFGELFSDLYLQYDYLLESKALRAKEKADFEEIVNEKASKTKLQSSLRKLSQYLERHHKEKVVILIDEYDSPIHVGYKGGYYKSIVRFIKPLLGGALKTNSSLYKGVLTGILRVSKESIFSDLNNIEVYSILQSPYADKFGFTESETLKLLTYFGLAENFPLVKKWYDGYSIGNLKDIYNPWSITGFVNSYNTEGFKAHWVNTSSDDLIKERIVEKSAQSIRDDIEALLLGKTIHKRIEERMVFSDFYTDKELLWSLLLYAGYLTPVQKEQDQIYQLKIPNYEINILFRRIIAHWLQRSMNITTSLLYNMINSLTHNRIQEFEKHFQAVMGDTFSYFDVTKNPEDVWQAYVLGLLSIAGEDYIIRSNRESGAGRYDILLLPKVKSKYGIVIEIKAMEKDTTQKQIDSKLEEALGQIEKNEYYQELIAHDIPKRIEIAMVFAGKKVYMQSK